MLTLLGAPDGTVYDISADVCNPQPSLWERSPDWNAFNTYLEMDKPITLPIKALMKIILSFDENPVPPRTMHLLLKHHHDDSLCIIDEQSLLVATKNISTNEETMIQLFNYISKNQIVDVEHYVSTKLIHECAKLNNINVTKAIVETYPEALNSCNQLGLRPIHVAFSYQNQSAKRSDMVRLLLKWGSKHGVGGAATGCGGVFLQRERNGKSGSNAGGSPIELALYYLRQKYSKDKDSCDDEWECLEVCLEIIMKSIQDFQLINFIISLDVGMERLIEDIVHRFDIDLNHTDNYGMTPLIVAIKERKVTYIRSLLRIQNCTKQLIQSCEINGNHYKNCLPLHIAVHEGISWADGLKEILESNPYASGYVDPISGLFSFMVVSQWKNNPLDDVYHLLQSNPGVVESCVVGRHLTNNTSSIIVKQYHFIMIVIIGIIIQYYFANTK